MEGVLEVAQARYNVVMEFREKVDDPRVADWPLMYTPWPTLAVCLFYTYFVTSLGPRFMKDRKPYELRNIMLVYNFCMVALCGYVMMEFLLSGWLAGYTWCQPVDFSRAPQAMRMATACWLFYITKFIELFDTVLFVLRKKMNQVSFLHVFHHAIMPLSWWFAVKWQAGGSCTFHALLNSFIHVMMYTYYGMAALGPRYQKFLWWKKYMTTLQLTQFFLVMVHSTYISFIMPACPVPIWISLWIYAYAIFFFILFIDFYRKAYKKPKGQAAANGNDKAARAKNE